MNDTILARHLDTILFIYDTFGTEPFTGKEYARALDADNFKHGDPITWESFKDNAHYSIFCGIFAYEKEEFELMRLALIYENGDISDELYEPIAIFEALEGIGNYFLTPNNPVCPVVGYATVMILAFRYVYRMIESPMNCENIKTPIRIAARDALRRAHKAERKAKIAYGQAETLTFFLKKF